jgi:hypothetical protein
MNRRGLGPFLRKGDYVEKAANNTARRGASTTRWVCSPEPLDK